MKKPDAIKQKIFELHHLLQTITIKRFDNRKIIFTNGCFDILHKGHAHLLNEASAVDNKPFLIVGLNSDASVRRLKGESRPVNAFDDRAIMLASLYAVDAVIGFDADTPYELIKQIGPDYLVKGGDYNPDAIIGADLVKANGGQVIVIPYLENYSTTTLISKMS